MPAEPPTEPTQEDFEALERAVAELLVDAWRAGVRLRPDPDQHPTFTADDLRKRPRYRPGRARPKDAPDAR